MQQSDYAAGTDDDTRKGHDGDEPVTPANTGGSGGAPSWPFSIKVTIEVTGKADCPPDVRVKNG